METFPGGFLSPFIASFILPQACYYSIIILNLLTLQMN